MAELPYQQTLGHCWSEFEVTLTDLDFVEAKCTAALTYDLVGDDGRLGILPGAAGAGDQDGPAPGGRLLAPASSYRLGFLPDRPIAARRDSRLPELPPTTQAQPLRRRGRLAAGSCSPGLYTLQAGMPCGHRCSPLAGPNRVCRVRPPPRARSRC